MATGKQRNVGPAVGAVAPIDVTSAAAETHGTGILGSDKSSGPSEGAPVAHADRDNPFGEFSKRIRKDSLLLILKMIVDGPPKGIVGSVNWAESDLSRDFSDVELQQAFVVASRIADNSGAALVDLLLNDDFKKLLAGGQKKRWAKERAARMKDDHTTPFEQVLARDPDMSAIEVANQLVLDGTLEHCDAGFRFVKTGKTLKLSSLDAKVSRQRKVLRNKERK